MDCDLYVYELLTDYTTLGLVGASLYAGANPENCANVTSGSAGTGYYFIEVRPYGATNANQYGFQINVSTTYDSYEADDNITNVLRTYTNTINIFPTIDNMFDYDMTEFTPQETGMYYISLNDVPDDCQYAFILYRADMSVVGSFASRYNASRRIELTAGQKYYTQVFSLNGNYNYSSPYNLFIIKRTPPAMTYDSNGIYINGAKIDLTYEYKFMSIPQSSEPSYSLFHRKDELYTPGVRNNFKINYAVPCSYKSKFKEAENALIVYVTNCTFWSYLHKISTNAPIQEPERNVFAKSPEDDINEFALIYDLDLGKTIDVIKWGYTYQFYGDVETVVIKK